MTTLYLLRYTLKNLKLTVWIIAVGVPRRGSAVEVPATLQNVYVTV
jgi:hypothetical protein